MSAAEPGVDPDFGLTAEDYARHRAGFPPLLFERLREQGIGLAGQRITDLGTGTGSLARGFAQNSCHVIGIDRAATMLDAAREIDARLGINVDYRVAPAEATAITTASQDVVSAGQCWHWFDRPRAGAELRRLLKPGGHALIAHFDWIPLAGNLVQATEALIEQYNPAWDMGGGCGLYPQWLRDLGEAGFENIESFSHDVDVFYSPIDWRGRIRASAGVGGSLTAARVTAFDDDLAQLLARDFPGEQLAIPHRCFAVTARAPAGNPGEELSP
ncbi:MAG: methyltransferase domain-containing protein [Gammaproteobacteria bacterium]|nr:methyltransferase domain-containing protein [Gammaproteobacteria bacterium]